MPRLDNWLGWDVARAMLATSRGKCEVNVAFPANPILIGGTLGVALREPREPGSNT